MSRRYSDGSKALTRAELDVLCGMLEGHSYEEIAAALGREHGTVRSQAASICSRLAVSTRGQAVRKALQLGILHVSDAPHGDNGACDSTCSDSQGDNGARDCTCSDSHGADDSSPPV